MILFFKSIYLLCSKTCHSFVRITFIYFVLCIFLINLTACNKKNAELQPTTSRLVENKQDISANKNITPEHKHAFTEHGKASWYGGRKIKKGHKTASGDAFDPHDYTAAHRFLPFGTKIKVTNLVNNKAVDVVITDRGPHTQNRVIDISRLAAKDLGMIQAGVTDVKVEIVECILDDEQTPVGEFWVIVNAPFTQSSLMKIKQDVSTKDSKIQVLSSDSKRKKNNKTKVSIGPYNHLKEAMAMTNLMHKRYANAVVVAK